jgi:hypothetical protein
MNDCSQDEEEVQPLMVIHLYCEENGDILVSEERFHNHTIRPTKLVDMAFDDFWQQLAGNLTFLEQHEHELGANLPEELAYLRQLRELGIIPGRGNV